MLEDRRLEIEDRSQGLLSQASSDMFLPKAYFPNFHLLSSISQPEESLENHVKKWRCKKNTIDEI